MSQRSSKGAVGQIVLRWGMLLSILLLLIAFPMSGRASVTLTEMTATLQADNTVLVRWVTATELDTAGFQMYRASGPTAPPANPGQWQLLDDSTQPARGDGQSGATYEYTDTSVGQDETYHYLLAEIPIGGTALIFYGNFVRSVTIGAPAQPPATATPTPTATTNPGGGQATPTRTPTNTNTPRPTVTPAQPGPPTATRQFPNSPTPPPTPTLTAGSAFNSGVPTPGQPTPLPGARVASPTPAGGVRPTAFVVTALPTWTQPPASALTVTGTPTLTASPAALAAAQQRTAETNTPSVARTPQVFEPLAPDKLRGSPTPVTDRTASSRLALTVGGGAIVLAGAFGLAGLILWRTRHR